MFLPTSSKSGAEGTGKVYDYSDAVFGSAQSGQRHTEIKAYWRPDNFVLISRILTESEALFPDAFNGRFLSLIGKAFAQSQKICKRYPDSPLVWNSLDNLETPRNHLFLPVTSARSHGEHIYAAGQDHFCSR